MEQLQNNINLLDLQNDFMEKWGNFEDWLNDYLDPLCLDFQEQLEDLFNERLEELTDNIKTVEDIENFKETGEFKNLVEELEDLAVAYLWDYINEFFNEYEIIALCYCLGLEYSKIECDLWSEKNKIKDFPAERIGYILEDIRKTREEFINKGY